MNYFVSILLIFSLSSYMLTASPNAESRNKWWKASVFYQINILRQFQSPDLLDLVFNFNFGSHDNPR